MKFYADIHCHPSMKPYGHSFPERKNDSNIRKKDSIWMYDPPNIIERAVDWLGGIVKYRQSDFSALGYGNVGIVCASLYPLEKGFFKNKLGTGKENDAILNFITSVGRERVDYIQGIDDYFTDLENEYDFYKQQSGNEFTLADNDIYKYVLAKNSNDIELVLAGDTTNNKNANSIAVVLTIEGAHVFGTGIDPLKKRAKPQPVLDNVYKVKRWEHRPLFITLAHHFYNELCGHAQSLSGIVKKTADQSFGINTGFTDLGRAVVHALLDNKEGNRIYIDIKHMSRLSRLEYFQMLDDDFIADDIPVIVSHGAVVGNDNNRHLFLQEDINFFDDEILRVAKTCGLFGLQLDERRIAAAGDYELKKSKGIDRRKVLYHSSVMVWRQIQHIAELLDAHGLFAWDIQCMGSDYDGVVNPINGYWTAENYPTLDDYLLKQAYNYMQGPGKNLIQAKNKIDPEEIVSRVMGNNAYRFMMKYFN